MNSALEQAVRRERRWQRLLQVVQAASWPAAILALAAVLWMLFLAIYQAGELAGRRAAPLECIESTPALADLIGLDVDGESAP